MAHNHGHHHHHENSGNIRLAFILNFSFAILEIFGGLFTNSLAILSDAFHDLGDSLSLGLAWYLEKVAEKDHDHNFSYGYKRFSLLGALINTLVLIFATIFILSRAIPRIINPESSSAAGMIGFALVGILVNGIAALRLRGSHSLNARVVAWHLLEDVLGWAAVLIVGIILLFRDIPWLDPALSILIACYILFNVIKNFKETVHLFLQGVPSGFSLQDLEQKITAVDMVNSIHHTHIWSLDGEHHVLTTHVVVDEHTPKENIRCVKEDIKSVLKEFNLSHITLEIEYGEDDCAMG